jgi:hypothetical protein
LGSDGFLDISDTWPLLLAINFRPGLLILMLFLLFLSAFFSMSEMAFAAVGKVKLKTLVEQNI